MTISLKKSFREGFTLSQPEMLFTILLLLTPVWWLLGVQVVLYPVVVVGAMAFGVIKFPNVKFPAPGWSWLAMALVMAFTAFIGLGSVGFEPMKVLAQVLAFIKGYFLIFSCLVLPCLWQLRTVHIRRAVVGLAILYLITIVISLFAFLVGFKVHYYDPILSQLTPGEVLSLRVFIGMGLQPFFGVMFPRTALFTADPPILGICALVVICICCQEQDQRLRALALTGASLALLFSFSRTSWLCLPVIFTVYFCLRSGTAMRISLWLGALGSMICGLVSLAPNELIDTILGVVNQARASSSTDRNRVITKTLEAWEESPWLGWGIIQGSVRWHTYDIALGSFSTYSAVLYLHGVLGLCFLIAAMGITLWHFTALAFKGNVDAAWATASLVALYICCASTPLTWMAPVLWFYFLWLGTVLQDAQWEAV
ncbi:MAG: O-antigen ligase family protein [Anaerolineae bacterium]|nr:O-antigen ligase family protein [Gloeobacterales cyanobacterium ES-bin-313]